MSVVVRKLKVQTSKIQKSKAANQEKKTGESEEKTQASTHLEGLTDETQVNSETTRENRQRPEVVSEERTTKPTFCV